MPTFESGGSPASGVSREPGMHRFRWDMRRGGIPGAGRGPLVPPGEYLVRLSVDDLVLERWLELIIDPRVAAEGVTVEDLEAQYEFNLRSGALLARARELAASVDSMRADLREASEGGRAAEGLQGLTEELTELHRLLVDAEGSYPQPMLISQIRYLLGMTSRADQAPGRDALVRFEELRRELDRLQARLDAARSGADDARDPTPGNAR